MMLMLTLIKVVITVMYMMGTIMSMIVVMILTDRLTKNITDIVCGVDAHFDHCHLSTSVNMTHSQMLGKIEYTLPAKF